MSKPSSKDNNPPKESTIVHTYSVARKDSGYYITRHTIKDNKVIESVQVSEPDVLVITMATLERLIRKELGL